jgi:hypothetical protein
MLSPPSSDTLLHPVRSTVVSVVQLLTARSATSVTLSQPPS